MAPTPLSTVRCSGKGNDEEEEESGGNQGVIIGITVVVVLLLAVVLTFHTQIVAYIKTQLKGGECYTLNTWVEGGINLILHVGIFSMFVCIFFFTVVHSVEKLTIYRNLKLTVDGLVQDLEASMQTPIDVDFHVEEDAETKRQDQESERKIKQLTRKGLTLFGTLLLLSIVTSAALYFGMYAYAKWKYLPCAARDCAISFSWCGNTRSAPPPWMSMVSPSSAEIIALHSMCQPGRPAPQGDGQVGSPGLLAFHKAKSRSSRFVKVVLANFPSPSAMRPSLPTFSGQSFP